MPDFSSSGDLFYRRLDVRPEASRDEILHAYRRLAHGAHPDTHPGDPDAAQRFREITEAYEVLADPSRRASYDRARAGLPIRVVVGSPGSSSASPSSVHTVANAEPGVLLGASRHPIADVPLRAGPARVEQPSKGPAVRGGDPDQTLMELIARIVDGWGRS